MKTIVGLGQAGCSIAEKFKKYPQYKIYKIDVGLKGANSYAIKHQDHPELYESKCPNLKTFLKEVSNEVLFITSSGDISGALLRILEQIKSKTDTSVLYIRPDLSLLSKTKKMQENLVFHVLQEYARSAALKRVYLVDNALLTEIVGDVPIKEHYNYLNEAIVSTMHMINVFDNSKSVLDNFSQPIDTARIFTFGLVDIEEESGERVFFDLQMPREKKYYYAYPEEIIESDGTLMKKIKKHIKKNTEHDKMKISYGIYSTNYEQPYVYCVSSSTLVQGSEKNT